MNLNMQAFNINTLLGGLDKVRDVMGVYQQQLLLIVIVFALLNCFFGYTLRKLWSVIPGFFSARPPVMQRVPTRIRPRQSPWRLPSHRSSDRNHCLRPLPDRTFSSDLRARRLCLWHLVNPNDITGYGLVALVAFVIGLICVPFERISVILVTSICGALTTIRMAYFFKDLDLNMMFWIVSAILAAAGMLFQFKPWKEADYWRMTTKKNANTVQKRAPDGSADPVSTLFHPERRKRNAAAPLPLLPATQEIRTAAIRNRRTVPVFRRTPCTISVLFRKNLTMTTMRKIFQKSSAAGHPQNRPLRRSLTKKKHPQKLPWATRSRIPLLPNRRSPRTASRMSISPRSGSRFPKRYREFTKTIRTRNPHCSAENPAGKGTFPCLRFIFYPDFFLVIHFFTNKH